MWIERGESSCCSQTSFVLVLWERYLAVPGVNWEREGRVLVQTKFPVYLCCGSSKGVGGGGCMEYSMQAVIIFSSLIELQAHFKWGSQVRWTAVWL